MALGVDAELVGVAGDRARTAVERVLAEVHAGPVTVDGLAVVAAIVDTIAVITDADVADGATLAAVGRIAVAVDADTVAELQRRPTLTLATVAELQHGIAAVAGVDARARLADVAGGAGDPAIATIRCVGVRVDALTLAVDLRRGAAACVGALASALASVGLGALRLICGAAVVALRPGVSQLADLEAREAGQTGGRGRERAAQGEADSRAASFRAAPRGCCSK